MPNFHARFSAFPAWACNAAASEVAAMYSTDGWDAPSSSTMADLQRLHQHSGLDRRREQRAACAQAC